MKAIQDISAMSIKQGIESGKLDPSLIMWQVYTLADHISETNTKLHNSIKQQDEREKRWAERFDSHQQTETKLCHIIESQSENIAMMHEAIKSLNDELKQINKEISIVRRNTEDIEKIQLDAKEFKKELIALKNDQIENKKDIESINRRLNSFLKNINRVIIFLITSIIAAILSKIFIK